MQEMIHGTMAGHDGSGYSTYSPWLDLAAAIVKGAADDYIKVLRKLWRGNASITVKRRLIAEKAELEEFFHSGWYGMLTDIDPDKLIYQCRIRAKEKEMAAIERANKKKIKELLSEAE
jgi:hypothetical protein